MGPPGTKTGPMGGPSRRRWLARLVGVAALFVAAGAVGTAGVPVDGASAATPTAATSGDTVVGTTHPVEEATPVTAGVTGDRTATVVQSGDALIEDGRTYFVGQVLFTDAFASDDQVELLRSNGELVRFLTPTDDGRVVVETARHGPGDYRLVGEDGAEIAFSVERQRYAVAATANAVLNGGDDTSLSILVESNRAVYEHRVSAANLSARELRSALGTGRTVDADGDGRDDAVLLDGGPRQTLAADFEDVTPGNYTLTFTVTDTGDREAVPVQVRLHPAGTATLSVEAGPLRVQQADNRELRGTSTLPEGTTLEVVVENASDRPFRLTRRATVRDGSFVATFDFSEVPVGQTFTVSVTQGPVTRDRVEGVVVRRAGFSEEVTVTRGSLTVGSATLPDGGYVVVSSVDGETLGSSELLPAGEAVDVTVDLDRPLDPGERSVVVGLRRDDGDGTFTEDDPAYRIQGATVSRALAVTVPEATTTARTRTTTTTTTITETTTDRTATTATTTEENAADGAGGDGLGAGVALVGVGLVVVIILFVLGAGRDEGGDSDSDSEGDDGTS